MSLRRCTLSTSKSTWQSKKQKYYKCIHQYQHGKKPGWNERKKGRKKSLLHTSQKCSQIQVLYFTYTCILRNAACSKSRCINVFQVFMQRMHVIVCLYCNCLPDLWSGPAGSVQSLFFIYLCNPCVLLFLFTLSVTVWSVVRSSRKCIKYVFHLFMQPMRVIVCIYCNFVWSVVRSHRKLKLVLWRECCWRTSCVTAVLTSSWDLMSTLSSAVMAVSVNLKYVCMFGCDLFITWQWRWYLTDKVW